MKILYILLILNSIVLPLYGVKFQLGSTLRMEDCLSLISILIVSPRLLNYRRTLPFQSIFCRKIIFLFIFLTLIGNILFLSETVAPEAKRYFLNQFGNKGFSVFRTELKPVQVFIKTIIEFSWIIVPIFAIERKEQIRQLGTIYFSGISVQALLALAQFSIYLLTGINIFPINRSGLFVEDPFLQDAAFQISGMRILRVNALCGEPKHLALFSLFSMGIALFFLLHQPLIARTRRIIKIFIGVQFLAFILTFSTTGYVGFGILTTCFFFYSSSVRRWLPFLLLGIGIWISLLALGPDSVATPSQGIVSEIVHARFLDRIQLDDFDQVYVEFARSHFGYMLFGTGFGNFHLASFEESSRIITSFKFGIILPKLGVFKIMATSGLIGLCVMLWLLTHLLSQLRTLINISERLKAFRERDAILSMHRLLSFLILSSILLRFTTFGLLWIGIGFSFIEIYSKSFNNDKAHILS